MGRKRLPSVERDARKQIAKKKYEAKKRDERNIKRRIENLSVERIEKKRAKDRKENLTAEQVERKRKLNLELYARKRQKKQEQLSLYNPEKNIKYIDHGNLTDNCMPGVGEQSEQGAENPSNPIIKCGEVQIIKNVWNVQFVCSQCGEVLQKEEQFLMHSLQHNLDGTEDDFKSIIKHITADQKSESNSFATTYNIPEVLSDLKKVKQECIAEEYLISEVNGGYCELKDNCDGKTDEESIYQYCHTIEDNVQVTDKVNSKSACVAETYHMSDVAPDLSKVKQEFVAEDYQMCEVNTSVYSSKKNTDTYGRTNEENIQQDCNPSGENFQCKYTDGKRINSIFTCCD